jgi:hypothetical protein
MTTLLYHPASDGATENMVYSLTNILLIQASHEDTSHCSLQHNVEASCQHTEIHHMHKLHWHLLKCSWSASLKIYCLYFIVPWWRRKKFMPHRRHVSSLKVHKTSVPTRDKVWVSPFTYGVLKWKKELWSKSRWHQLLYFNDTTEATLSPNRWSRVTLLRPRE